MAFLLARFTPRPVVIPDGAVSSLTVVFLTELILSGTAGGGVVSETRTGLGLDGLSRTLTPT